MEDKTAQSAATATTQPPPDDDESGPSQPGAENDLVVEELLVEDVSIDGMCGVY